MYHVDENREGVILAAWDTADDNEEKTKQMF